MKQVVLEEPGRLVVRQVDDPSPGPGDVVLEVRAALTCGTDLKTFRRGHPKFPCPTPFGHEASGVVVARGSDAPFEIGDPVMTANSGPCGACYWCANDEENLCETLTDELLVGAYAEYLLVPSRILRRNAFRKPDALSFEHAALLEPLASVCFGLTKIPARKVRDGATVLLIGSGPIAMLWLRALQAHGADRVIVASRGASRLETARRMGAVATVAAPDVGRSSELAATISELSAGRGCDAVIECTGQPDVWQQAPALARRGGSVVLFGGCATGTTVTFDTGKLHYDGVEITSPFHFRPRDVAEAKRLLCREDLDWSPLVSGRAALAEVPALFTNLGSRGEMKMAIVPHEEVR